VRRCTASACSTSRPQRWETGETSGRGDEPSPHPQFGDVGLARTTCASAVGERLGTWAAPANASGCCAMWWPSITRRTRAALRPMAPRREAPVCWPFYGALWSELARLGGEMMVAASPHWGVNTDNISRCGEELRLRPLPFWKPGIRLHTPPYFDQNGL